MPHIGAVIPAHIIKNDFYPNNTFLTPFPRKRKMPIFAPSYAKPKKPKPQWNPGRAVQGFHFFF